MEIFVNGEARHLSAPLSVAALLTELGVAAQRVAVELNTEIVPRSSYDAQQLHAGDRVEMVHAVGGG
ncbi:MAG TPA: sulfur carrier protein ThiS [Gammaproteobacteria bacterium]|nr:sulfur carrier protein ThiS [Gammaproteobacteria bacterium]